MDTKSELIKEDIEQTRAALTEKLVSLEDQLLDKVETAKDTVEKNIENVKEAFRKVSPTHQVRRHPFAMIGGSVAAGVIMGKVIQSRSARAKSWETVPHERKDVSSVPRRPGLLSRLAETFPGEVAIAKDFAFNLAVEGLREIAKEALPRFEVQIDRAVASAARRRPRDRGKIPRAAPFRLWAKKRAGLSPPFFLSKTFRELYFLQIFPTSSPTSSAQTSQSLAQSWAQSAPLMLLQPVMQVCMALVHSCRCAPGKPPKPIPAICGSGFFTTSALPAVSAKLVEVTNNKTAPKARMYLIITFSIPF